MPRSDKPAIPQEETDAVVALVDKYVTALLQPDIDTLKTCFYNDGTVFGCINGEVAGGPIQVMYDIMERDGGLPHLEWTINVLSITPSTAVAQVLLFQESPRYEVTDLLSLIKLSNGGWTIVGKILEMYQYFKEF